MNLTSIVMFAATSVVCFAGVALALVAWPQRRPKGFGGAAGAEMAAFVEAGGFVPPAPPRTFIARDGAKRVYRLYGAGADVLVFLHGSGGDSRYLAKLATAVAAGARLRVATLDMRGHGVEPGRRGDVDHVEQQEHDIADLCAHVAGEQPIRKLLVGGHSIGGGLAIRYAAGRQTPRPDGVVLLSPYVHRRSPSARKWSGGWALPRVTRFAGIEMLHRLGIHAFDRLPVIEFAVSPSVRDGTETPHYSWRLFSSVTPRADWRGEIAAITCPVLVLGAEKDVIFDAAGYAQAFAGQPRASVDIVPGIGHFGLSMSDEAPARINRWLATNGLGGS